MREPERACESDLAVARQLADRIVAGGGERVSRIILFGSRARGDAKPDSDFDLLVVVRGLVPADWEATVLGLYQVCRGLGVAVEPHAISEEEFDETRTIIGGLAYPAAKEGVVLYERPCARPAGAGRPLAMSFRRGGSAAQSPSR